MFIGNKNWKGFNKALEFSRVVKAREQVVAGMLHHLTVEAIDGGKKKLYEAKILVQPWLNVQKLTEFTHAGDSPSITPSDLGANRESLMRKEW
ncbi:Cysteine proteinase inhibitor 6-like protein [Drosera capensis]